MIALLIFAVLAPWLVPEVWYCNLIPEFKAPGFRASENKSWIQCLHCLGIHFKLCPYSENSGAYVVVSSFMTIIIYSQEIAVFGRYFLGWNETKNMR
jgi:hypothetical protein